MCHRSGDQMHRRRVAGQALPEGGDQRLPGLERPFRSLRQPGGAAGGKDARQDIVAIGRLGRSRRVGGQEGFQRGDAAGALTVQADQDGRRLQQGAELQRFGFQAAVIDQGVAAHQPQPVPVGLQGVPGVDRRPDRTQPEAGQDGGEGHGVVGTVDTDPRRGAQPRRGQGARQALDIPRRLAPGDHPVPFDEGGKAWSAAKALIEIVDDAHGGLVSGGAQIAGWASTRMAAITQGALLRLTQACFVPRCTMQSPAWSRISPSSMSMCISPDMTTR